MRLRELIDDILGRVDDWYKSTVGAMLSLGSGLAGFLKHQAFLAWLTFLAAAASTVATAFSYFAAEKSAEVASQAQSFSERTNREQLALGRPVLSVMGGRVDSWTEDDGDRKNTKYRLELTIHNSGARASLPAWIGLFQRDVAFGDQRSPSQRAWEIGRQVADIPSGSDMRVIFDIGDAGTMPTDWTLALAYGDDTPDGANNSGTESEKLLQKRCSPVKVVLLHASRSPATAANAPSDWTVTSATPVLIDHKAMSDGITEPEAVGRQMEGILADDVRCATHPKP
jgi:hypothetical protein